MRPVSDRQHQHHHRVEPSDEVVAGGGWWWLVVAGGGWWWLVVAGGGWWWYQSESRQSLKILAARSVVTVNGIARIASVVAITLCGRVSDAT
jgi:hypothetical protein